MGLRLRVGVCRELSVEGEAQACVLGVRLRCRCPELASIEKFRVQGLGFRVWGLGFRVWVLGFHWGRWGLGGASALSTSQVVRGSLGFPKGSMYL